MCKFHVEASIGSSAEKRSNFLWNLKVLHRVRTTSQLAPILCQINPLHTVPRHFFKIIMQMLLQRRTMVWEPNDEYDSWHLAHDDGTGHP
jgi:hypothetical protein